MEIEQDKARSAKRYRISILQSGERVKVLHFYPERRQVFRVEKRAWGPRFRIEISIREFQSIIDQYAEQLRLDVLRLDEGIHQEKNSSFSFSFRHCKSQKPTSLVINVGEDERLREQ